MGKLQNSSIERGFARPLQKFSLIIVLSSLFIQSCSQPTSDTSGSKPSGADARNLTAMVSVEGSDTMAELLKLWTKKCMEDNPSVPISVTVDDSGSGIAALINKTTDLAAASRDLSEAESKLARQKGIRLKRTTVARDSIAVIVNPANTVNELTLEQLRDLFSGKALDWKELGASASARVQVLAREPESGTYSYVKTHVLNGQEYAPKTQTVTSNEAMLSAVKADKGAVGYVGLGFVLNSGKKVKPLKLKLERASNGVSPSKENTIGLYPLSRPLFFFCDADAKPTVKQFIEFCLSEKGQKVVTECGYVSGL